jgi:hypothetical protein
MSVRNGFVLLVALFALTFLVACGGGSPKVVPPPSGGFSDSNLSGTYVFSSSGVDTSGAFLSMVGTLTANGTGTISSGIVDIDGANVAAAAQALSGSYSITADGRGQIKFGVTVTVENSAGTGTTTQGVTFILDFVLTSNSHGLVTEFDGNGTGSGTIDLQSTVSQAQFAGSYAFGVSGVGTTSGSPFAAVGTLTLDSTGAVTAGEEDINNAGAYSGAPSSITATTSTVTVGTAPGTASLAVAGVDTFTFDVFPIDNTHLKLIETDGLLLTSGDVFTQGTSIPTGQLVFTMAGENLSAQTPLDSGGWLTNNSGTISAGLEDFNDGGNVNTVTAVGGSIAPVTGGRSVFTLTGFVNGAANDVAGTYTFAAYPFTAGGVNGVQLLEIDNVGITSGTADGQTATTLASQGFGLNLTGTNISQGQGAFFDEDDIAEFTTSSSGFSGIVDLNDNGTTTFDKGINTTNFTAPDSNGRGQAVTNFFSFNFYTVNSSTVLLLEIDSTQPGLGTFEVQSASGASSAAQPAASLMRPVAHAHRARSRQK